MHDTIHKKRTNYYQHEIYDLKYQQTHLSPLTINFSN